MSKELSQHITKHQQLLKDISKLKEVCIAYNIDKDKNILDAALMWVNNIVDDLCVLKKESIENKI